MSTGSTLVTPGNGDIIANLLVSPMTTAIPWSIKIGVDGGADDFDALKIWVWDIGQPSSFQLCRYKNERGYAKFLPISRDSSTSKNCMQDLCQYCVYIFFNCPEESHIFLLQLR
jgi:hypothetical protein